MEQALNWLLEDAAPEIKYRALVELLDAGRESVEAVAARHQLLNSPVIAMVVDKLKAGDKWDSYKSLCALAEFGLTRRDLAIDDEVEQLIEKTGFKMLCGEGLLLRNLVLLGYREHPRVSREIPLALSLLKEDGGFQCISKNKKINDPRLPHKSCYRLTASYLLLAAELYKNGEDLPQKDSLTGYYLNRQVLYRHDNPERFVVPEMAGTFYPLDPIKLGLQMILYALAVLGEGNRPECDKALSVLESKKDSEGKYLLDKALSKPNHKIGKPGYSNKWITLYALLIKKYRDRT